MTQFNTNAVQPTTPAAGTNGLGIAGFVCGVVGVAGGCLGGFVLSPIAIVLSALGMKKVRHWGLSLAGLILGIVGTAWLVIMLSVFGTLWGAAVLGTRAVTNTYQQQLDKSMNDYEQNVREAQEKMRQMQQRLQRP